MVHAQHQQLIVRRDFQHAELPQRTGRQIKVQSPQPVCSGLLWITAIQRNELRTDPAVRDIRRLQHLLCGYTVVFDEAGAQHRMSRDERRHGNLQRIAIKPAAQTHRPGQVPGPAVRLQAVEKPQPLLHR